MRGAHAIARELHEQGLTYEEIGQRLGVSRQRAWQLANPKHYLAYQRERYRLRDHPKPVTPRKRTRVEQLDAVVRAAKANGCVDCGSRGPLLMHHLDPTTKRFDISLWRSNGRSVEELHEEMAGCIALCRKCSGARYAKIRWVAADYAPTRSPKAQVRALVAEFKANGCADCGSNPEDKSLLHCHHTDPASKHHNVARLMNTARSIAGVRRVEAELLLCEPLCQRCHVARHRELRRVAADALHADALQDAPTSVEASR